MKLKSQINEMIQESKNPRNDGWVQKGYKDNLKEIYFMIEREYPELRYPETDGLEVGSPEDYEDKPWIFESPDNGKTVFKRKQGDYNNKERIK